MIHLSSIPVENNTPPEDWKSILSQSKITTKELLEYCKLDHHPLASSDAEGLFSLIVPRTYLEKIEKGNPNDPLLLQVLPQKSEHIEVAGFTENPLKEDTFSPVKGLIHKYPNRVLLITTSACVINCRYCFRRTFPYGEHRQSKAQWKDALNYISQRKMINEVILSGGDPLIQNNDSLFWLLSEIDAIAHIKRIRIHSRLLISLPQRIDKEFVERFKMIKKQKIIVTHCNHSNELGDDVKISIDALRSQNVTLLNQSVLLKSINDQPETLTELSEALFDTGILPYYLFLLDPVAGAAHFDISLAQAKDIYKQLLTQLPGFLTPRLSIEIPGEQSKTPIGII